MTPNRWSKYYTPKTSRRRGHVMRVARAFAWLNGRIQPVNLTPALTAKQAWGAIRALYVRGELKKLVPGKRAQMQAIYVKTPKLRHVYKTGLWTKSL